MPIVTISRGTESGGARLASSLNDRLGLKAISREVVLEAAETYGVSEEGLLDSLQSPPGFWDKQARRRQQYILAVKATLARMVEEETSCTTASPANSCLGTPQRPQGAPHCSHGGPGPGRYRPPRPFQGSG